MREDAITDPARTFAVAADEARSAQNIRDERFLEQLKRIMLKRRLPQSIIESLFESGPAAPEAGAFLGR